MKGEEFQKPIPPNEPPNKKIPIKLETQDIPIHQDNRPIPTEKIHQGVSGRLYGTPEERTAAGDDPIPKVSSLPKQPFPGETSTAGLKPTPQESSPYIKIPEK